jgi:hypothetical protein
MLTLATAVTAIAVGLPAPSALAAPSTDSPTCSQLTGMRDAYYHLYSRTKNDGLLVVVARYTWDATDAGCFGTEPALRQRAFAQTSTAWS